MLPASVESYGENIYCTSQLTLLFGCNRSIISKIIRLRTWGDVSHVAPLDPLTNTVLEAKGGKNGGVVETCIEDFYSRYDEVLVRYHPGDLEVIRKHLGLGFDMHGLYGQFLHRDWQNPKKLFCAESVALGSFIIDNKEAHKQNAQSIYAISSDKKIRLLPCH